MRLRMARQFTYSEILYNLYKTKTLDYLKKNIYILEYVVNIFCQIYKIVMENVHNYIYTKSFLFFLIALI